MASQIKTGFCSGARAKEVKQPHELMAEWAQTGLMEIPVRRGNYSCKEYYIIPMGMRFRIAAACAPYYRHKLRPMKVSEAQTARCQRVMDEAQQMATASVYGHKSAANNENSNVEVESGQPQKDSN